jgi:hypothetical protein
VPPSISATAPLQTKSPKASPEMAICHAFTSCRKVASVRAATSTGAACTGSAGRLCNSA